MDEIEREAIRDEGYDPDDPAVVAALNPGARRAGRSRLHRPCGELGGGGIERSKHVRAQQQRAH
jgi:hypothetical protein